jgi:PAS domain S-box-containing protein
MISQDKVIGVLSFLSTQPEAYTEKELRVAEEVGNQIAGAIANAQLFAACRQAEETVRKEKEKAQKYLDVAGAIIAVIESNQRVSLINQMGCEVLGYEEGEIIGANWMDTFLPEWDRDRMKAVFARLMAGEVGPVEYFENPILTKNGEEKLIAWYNTLLRDQAGTILGVLSSGEDISERKRAETEIRNLLQSVEQKREELRALTIRLQEVEEAERRRLAQELHDRVGQNFAALSINLNIIQRELPAEFSGKVGARLEDSLQLLEETALHIRDVMAELRPPVLDDYGLLAALQWYGEQFTKRTGVPSVIQGAEATPRLPLPLEAALFRVTQEALTNVARHAQARQVTVTLEELAQEVRLTIADDGTGFDFSFQSETRSAWGLISMRERAEAIGGRFQVKSAPGEGTRIMVAVRK